MKKILAALAMVMACVPAMAQTFTVNNLVGTGTTNSTSSTTGAAKFAGGLGVAQDLWIGGTFHGGAAITSGSFNGTVGATTPSTGAFTTLSASSTVSGAGFTSLFASPPAIGSTTPSTGAFTTLSASSTVSGTGFSTYLASPPAIGGVAPNTGNFTTLSTTAQSKVIMTDANAQSIPNNTSTVVTTWTSTLNQGSNFNASTGVYTCPTTGTYRVSAGLQLASATYAAGNLISLRVLVNGTLTYQTTMIITAAATQPFYTNPISVMVNCTATNTISLAILHTQGGAVALSGVGTNNFLMIDQMP